MEGDAGFLFLYFVLRYAKMELILMREGMTYGR